VGSTHARRHVEFLHVSKSGGTSMCAVAQQNGCSNPRFDLDGNCLIEIFRQV
jgi:hypothetical protein